MNKGERTRVEKYIEDENFEGLFDIMKGFIHKFNERFVDTELWFSHDIIKKFNSELDSLYLSFDNGEDRLFFFRCNSVLSDLLLEFDENLTPFIILDIYEKVIPLLGKDSKFSQLLRFKQDVKKEYDPYADVKLNLDNYKQDMEFIDNKIKDIQRFISPKFLNRGEKEFNDKINDYQEELKEFLKNSFRSDQYIKDILAKISQAYELFNSFGIFLLLFLRQNKKLKYGKYKRAFLKGQKLIWSQIYLAKKYQLNQNSLLRELLIEKFSENSSIVQILDWIFAFDGIRGLRNLNVHSLSDPTRLRISKKEIEVNYTGKSPFKENSEIIDLKTLFLYSRELHRLIAIIMSKILSAEFTGLLENFKYLKTHPEKLVEYLNALNR